MSDRVVMAAPDERVTDVADKMLDGQIHHIPVVDADDNLLGIISTMDILAALRTPIPQ
jgi:CBS domain-containing protein